MVLGLAKMRYLDGILPKPIAAGYMGALLANIIFEIITKVLFPS